MIQELKLKEFNKRLKRLPLAQKQNLVRKEPVDSSENLHVVYVMSHVGVSGGVKIIFEHVKHLKKLGIQVSIVSHFEKPAWYPIEADYVQVPFDMELAKGIPNCEVIVATYWDHIQACIETGIAPVVYFEQGDFHLFEHKTMNATLKKFIQKQYELPEFIYTVSESTAQFIDEIYNREAKVIHNAIDEKIFSDQVAKYNSDNPYLLMIGAESAKFKGIKDIIEAYEPLKDSGLRLDLYWITPEEPSEEMKNKVTKYFVQPNQGTIAQLYRGASVFVSASHYESFSLPPLEAMACGCPVVTTNNKGVLEYAVHEENALISEVKNPEHISSTLKRLLTDKPLRDKIIQNGLITARKYSWDQIMKELLRYYKGISSYKVSPNSRLDEWDIILREDMFIQKEDIQKFEKFLQYSEADLVQVPVVYDMDGFVRVARWEVVANRKQSMSTNIETCYCPVLPKNHFSILNDKAYRAFYKREYDEALEEFTKQVYDSEVGFLSLVLEDKKERTSFQRISLLGDTTSYPEYLFNLKNLAKHYIK